MRDRLKRVFDRAGTDWRIGTLTNTLLICALIVTSAFGYSKMHDEAATREDQICTSAERENQTNVRQYADTIKYLMAVKRNAPEKLSDPINRFVILRLPETEKKARKDTAPPLCDKPDRGLPEPDPVLPEWTAERVQRFLAK